ncbi:spore coat protein [Priestia megaterium]|uniref:spore coat protein n=1 Tax=Priestia megaterium TaxID=1404 RepID=UPI001C302CD6|nr:spore coat protein [Priestia megaterium]MCP1450764.1 spore coat protein B [Priestia megaterium]MED4049706.1 spore coat protein [Priestia megaterium]WJD82277.1 spore coat protein [Priestia megaterium]
MSNYYYDQNQDQTQNANRSRARKVQQSESTGYSAHFKPLKGRVVTVYRGGPESKTGYLIDVQSDYLTLALETKQNNNQQNNQPAQLIPQQQYTFIYYQLAHVKSITEDTKSNSAQTFSGFNSEVELHRANTFAGTLLLMKDKQVQINQGGPEKKLGKILDVLGSFESAYVVLLTEDDGVVYINVEHIKSVSEVVSKNTPVVPQNPLLVEETPEYIKAKSFNELFEEFSHRWVAINGGGPEAVEGVLVQSRNGNFTLVQNNQVLRLQPRHVKTIALGSKGSFKQNEENSEQNGDTNEEDSVQESTTVDKTGGRTDGRTGDRTGRRTGRRTGGRTDDRSGGRRTGSRSSTPGEKVIKTKNYRWKA